LGSFGGHTFFWQEARIMERLEKSVFISYTYTNARHALAIYQTLSPYGYDCYLERRSLNGETFDEITFSQVKARAHFILILTPSAMAHCADPDSPLRYEIELALDMERNIIPVLFTGFNFSSPAIEQHLKDKFALLNRYQTQLIPEGFCDEAMERVHKRYLNSAVDVKRYPTPEADKKIVYQRMKDARQQSKVTMRQLSAEQYFERAYQHAILKRHTQCLADYAESIRLRPKYATTYNHRGIVYSQKGDFKEAMVDFTNALRLKPDYAEAFINRGVAQHNRGDYDGAIADYSEAIRLNPDDAAAYNNRGTARDHQGDLEGAIVDFSEALRIAPEFQMAQTNLNIVQDRL
jgi:tetratricopeptide (TPR) repeat protein